MAETMPDAKCGRWPDSWWWRSQWCHLMPIESVHTEKNIPSLSIYIHLHIYMLIEQMVVVMAGDDGDEQRTERTDRPEQK